MMFVIRIKRALIAIATALIATPCGALPEFDFQIPEAAPKAPKLVKQKTSADDLWVDLDMSCPREVVPAELAFQAERFNKPAVTIAEGENLRTVSKNCMLTAAEYFATRQKMQEEQKLELRENGTAAGGTVVLDKYTAEHCRNLYVPRHIVAVQDSTQIPSADYVGELHVAGAYDVRGNAAQSAIKAKRIKIYPGGWIGTTSPQVKSVALKAAKIETNLVAPAPIDSAQPPNSGDYELKPVETVMTKALDEFIPTEGTEASVEIGVYRQQRESCLPK